MDLRPTDLNQATGWARPGRRRQRRPTEIVLRIDELVLEGFPAHHRQRIAAALESELTRLVAEGGLPSELAEAVRGVDAVEAPGFGPKPTARPEEIGAEVARAVYAGLGQIGGSEPAQTHRGEVGYAGGEPLAPGGCARERPHAREASSARCPSNARTPAAIFRYPRVRHVGPGARRWA